MSKKIIKLIENKGLGDTECTKVLGSSAKVNTVANFYERNAELLHLISTDALLEFVETNKYTHDELTCFKLGVASIGEFMSKCWAEREARKQLQESQEETKH